MVSILFRRLIIPLILTKVSLIQSGKEHILNFDDHGIELDKKSQAMADLTSKCYSNDAKPLCIGEKLNDDLATHLYESMLTTIVSVDSSKLIEERLSAAMRGDERHKWKSGAFLLPASSPVDLKNQLDFVKLTPWWNSAGLFIFSDADDVLGERCSNAYATLSLAWKYGLLSSVYLCQEIDGSLTIYSYNPYSHSAPQPWQMVRQTEGKNGHPWNLYKWSEFDGRDLSCGTIFFDKTKSLGGYPIEMNALSAIPMLHVNKSANGAPEYNGLDGVIIKELWGDLNASIVVVPHPDDEAFLGWVDGNGTFHGNLKDIASGRVELGMNQMILQPIRKVTSTYPFMEVKFCFVVKDRGSIPWLIGLPFIFDKTVIACAAVVFSLSAILFGYFNRGRYISGFLNTLRIFVSSSLVSTPRSTHLRIIMCFVFLFPIVSYSTIQGRMLSVMRNPFRYENIETLEELVDQGYQIEASNGILHALKHSTGSVAKFVHNDFDECLEKLYRDERVACLDYCYSLRVKAAYHEKLHIARESSPSCHSRYVAKPDWPLVNRFDSLMERYFEAGLKKNLKMRGAMKYLKISSRHSDTLSDDAPQQITLKDFRYVFMGIAFGWAFAIVAFFGELIIDRMRKIKLFRIRW